MIDTAPTADIFTWKELIFPIIIALASSVATYLATKAKSKSEINKIDAETLKTYLNIIKDIQDNNQTLYEKLQVLRDKVESVDELLDQCQEDLVNVRAELDDCRSNSSIIP